MAIRYIFGRAGRGKSYLALEEIKQKLQEEEDNKLFLLVPEQFTLQAERDLIRKQELTGMMRAEVLSFTRLAHRVFSEVGGLTRVPINELGKNMILRKIADESLKELSIYQSIAKQDGFITKLNELICEMKQHDITPTELTMELNEIEEETILKRKLEDITLLYQRFNNYLKGQYVDNEDHVNLLIENIERVEFLEGAEIWIDGFQSFTPQIIRVIEKLAQKVANITITFTMELNAKEKDKDLFHITQKTYLKVKTIAQKFNLDEEVINLDIEERKVLPKEKEIAHIEREFNTYPYKQYADEIANLEIFAGSNLYSEMENVAAQIIHLVRNRGYRWNDIALVSGGLDQYSMILKRVFEEYHIPYFIDEKRSIMNNPMIELILSSIEILSRGYQYEDVFSFLKTGFSDLTKDEVEQLENYVLQYGIRGKAYSEPFTKGFEKKQIQQKDKEEGEKQIDEEKKEKYNELRMRFIAPFAKFEKRIYRKKKIGEITKALFEFMKELNIEDKLNQWIEELREEKYFEYVNENTQIWNKIMEIFDQLTEILADESATLKEYGRILEAGFLACKVGVIPSTIDQVLVGSIERSKSHDIKALFVVGVNDGVLPFGQEDGGILLDHERESLVKKGISIGTTLESSLLEEQFMIYSAFSKPTEYLWVSYALADQEGKAMRQSILIDRFKKLFKNLRIKSDVVNDVDRQLHLITTPISTFKYMTENIRQNVDDKAMADMWWDVYDWYSKEPTWEDRRKLMVKGLFHQNQITYIGENKAKSLYDNPIKSSVSRLERFANCPFSHFVTYGLRPKERKEYQLSNPDIGRLFHDSMEQFTKEMVNEEIQWKDLTKEKNDELVEKVIDEMVPDFEHGIMLSTHRYQYLVTRLKRISKRAMWTLTDHVKKGEFVPMGHEIIFGLEGDVPPIIIELANGEKIYLEGRIDRVDLLNDEEDGNYVKIIDYKSGSKEFSLSDVYYGLQIQLMVYLDAILSSEEKKHQVEIHPGGIFYFKIDDPMVKTTEKVVEEVEKEINKKLKMKGLVLKDVNIIKKMDRSIGRSSTIVPAGLTKDDEISKSSSALPEEDFKALLNHVRRLVKEIGEEMLKGNVKIEPFKKGGDTSCKYCDYIAICQFDNSFHDNQYKNIKELKSDEVLERIKKESQKKLE
ncbi:ATP-dependent nuclease subunit AddB [Alkaliphilus metalliredigens QYMF]|uniref:ATP-dependent helicase/deoxyribonuclease subunit B n=1 Tax=Alkaliphilus metalliredigens (strain QYMF) TaxID=293826 RepID=ADDB_ALKMQ|nr:helicase-exonuclease AddAB subunit AddB [Alkaliphilus metalliredigens]A6TVN9.1 RecName: Full=ATP-dependent helicase/deoxyribonuclease subunit B; AltName: Full=ATP-dependent helicase/nuclease AddB; AltName: Full=DNA 3'-5' helicase AddB [Alkaliphilus metalliredigens QYMF]ABR50257.1 ATP-dependent nuclease subunit AddB [Alkaliphilus metalliredigens QYMF]